MRDDQIRMFCARALDHAGHRHAARHPQEDQEAVRERVDADLRTEAGKPIDYSNQPALGEGFEGYIEWRSRHPSNDLMTELLNVEFEDEA